MICLLNELIVIYSSKLASLVPFGSTMKNKKVPAFQATYLLING